MSIKDIMNALVISLMFFLIFSIIFVIFFKGKFFKCNYPNRDAKLKVYANPQQCLNAGGIWENRVYHYDSVPDAMLALFTKAITVGWATFMYDSARTVDEGYTLSENKQNIFYSLLSVVFMIFCSLFILNIFGGIVIATFNREEEKISKRVLMNNFQRKWLNALDLIIMSKPHKKI